METGSCEENEIEEDDKNTEMTDIPVLNFCCKRECDKAICECQVESVRGFYNRFMIPNLPCVVSREATADWKSVNKWVDENGKPDFDYLLENFTTAEVPVADCNVKYYNAQQKCTMKFGDYINYWRQLILDDYDFKTHGNLYLKDWHFTKDFPSYKAYDTPLIFSSDWLNEFWSKRNDVKDDYRFVYMGPKGSWTPLHVDVYHSYSWSANVCGRKLWILFPPEEGENLKDVKGNLPFDIASAEMNDPITFPNYNKIKKRYRVIQEPGQIIFIPSGWIHQVHNLEDTISINHNWFNGCNIQHIWDALLATLYNVQREILDCKDMENWDEQCQLITRSTYGMDVKEFWTLLETTAESKIEALKAIRSQREKNTFDERLPLYNLQVNLTLDDSDSDNHFRLSNPDMSWKEEVEMFELSKILDILQEIKNDSKGNLLPLTKVLHLHKFVNNAVHLPVLSKNSNRFIYV